MGKTGADPDGFATLFFVVDGQLQLVRIAGPAATGRSARVQAEDGNPAHVGATLAGTVVAVAVGPGQRVTPGEALVAIEAMKMEMHVVAEREACVSQVHVEPGDTVSPRDLLVSLTFVEPSPATTP
jgi:pyruvate carboxylase